MTSFRFALCLCLCCASLGMAQESNDSPWRVQKTGVASSLRGLCVVDSKTVWASGAGGTVIRTIDAGQTWKNVSVKQADELDFRDIHALDAKKAIVINAGQPACIYQTSDGGETWFKRFEHPHEKSFFDAMSFWDAQHGIAMSDPVDSRVLLIETKDGGTTWAELAPGRRPEKKRGEAGFAASGTNMCVVGTDSVFIALGGAEPEQNEATSRIVFSRDRAHHWAAASVPIPRNQSSGIFSMAFDGAKRGIVVGGDYLKPERVDGNIAITNDGGKSWNIPTGTPPRGYRSGVAVLRSNSNKLWVAVGPSGTDYSADGGQNWKPASEVGFHAIRFSSDGSTGYASGSDGRVAKWLGIRH